MIPTNSIICGDCAEGLAGLPSGLVPLTVTSPPYDNVRDFAAWDFERVAEELYRVTNEGGMVCWVVQDGIVKGRRTGTSFRQALQFMSLGFWMWDELIVVLKSYQLPSRRRLVSHSHHCFLLTKGRPNTVNLLRDKPNKCAGMMKWSWHRRRSDGSMRRGYWASPIAPFGYRSNVWEYATGYHGTTPDKEAFAHPALMPEALARDLILSFSRPYDIVLDPFMGAGTTAKMAMLNGRRWLGFEVEARYVALAEERLRKAERVLWATGQTRKASHPCPIPRTAVERGGFTHHDSAK
jgi:DNA modification methylase